jgi:hypothetical protein
MICNHYTGRTRCTAPATHFVHSPDGRRVPGGWICLPHGSMIVKEYREKLKQAWTLLPLEDGKEGIA